VGHFALLKAENLFNQFESFRFDPGQSLPSAASLIQVKAFSGLPAHEKSGPTLLIWLKARPPKFLNLLTLARAPES
jgi:hypothetical protein